MQIERFAFNDFQVNTYLLYDESRECVIIDPGCYYPSEKDQLVDFIENNKLKPVRQIYTHCHVDHLLGINFIFEKYGVKPEIHKDGAFLLPQTEQFASMYGFEMEEPVKPDQYIAAGDEIKFGKTLLSVIDTPGHVNGSVCFIHHESKSIITGDVLFRDSIGRTDLPTGDFNLLKQSIHDKLFILSDDYTAYPGHGPETTIGYEKENNPFVGKKSQFH